MYICCLCLLDIRHVVLMGGDRNLRGSVCAMYIWILIDRGKSRFGPSKPKYRPCKADLSKMPPRLDMTPLVVIRCLLAAGKNPHKTLCTRSLLFRHLLPLKKPE